MSRVIAVALLAALVLPGCAARAPQSRASAEQQAACRQRADQSFLTRDPGVVYNADAYVSGSRDTPFSATGAAGNTTSDLPGRYTRDTMYSDCLNGIGPPTGAGPQPQPQPTP